MTNNASWFPRGKNVFDELHCVLVHANLIGVAGAARKKQGVEIVCLGLLRCQIYLYFCAILAGDWLVLSRDDGNCCTGFFDCIHWASKFRILEIWVAITATFRFLSCAIAIPP